MIKVLKILPFRKTDFEYLYWLKSMYSRTSSLISKFSWETLGFSNELSSRIVKISALSFDLSSFKTPLFSRVSASTLRRNFMALIFQFLYDLKLFYLWDTWFQISQWWHCWFMFCENKFEKMKFYEFQKNNSCYNFSRR